MSEEKQSTIYYVDEKSFEEMVQFFKEDPDGFERWRAGVLLREFLKIPSSRRKYLQEVFKKYELKKTFEEWVIIFEGNTELFKEWRLYFLRREIFRFPLSKQARLHAILNGLEMKMARYGVGTARYNEIVSEFLEVTLRTFHEALQGKIQPKPNGDNVIPLS